MTYDNNVCSVYYMDGRINKIEKNKQTETVLSIRLQGVRNKNCKN